MHRQVYSILSMNMVTLAVLPLTDPFAYTGVKCKKNNKHLKKYDEYK